MPSRGRQHFTENRKDVEQLWQIHQEVAGGGVGRKYGVDVLNRAAIVFITASWESYVEDVAVEAFDFLITNVPRASDIPSKVRDMVTRPLFEQKDSRKVWELAEAGWRDLLIAHKQATLDRWVGTLNTPKSGQVNTLFEDLLGIQRISLNWSWQNMTPEQAERKLDEYVTVRGNIAHRTEHDETVYKNWSSDYLGHVESLVERTESAVGLHLLMVTGKNPW